ncbi:MAG TPA: hypothetical protein VFV78_12990 [Vicinamibacterales bacterium]|nr:hypothetical protein [Vicinamibacterales bacterium]
MRQFPPDALARWRRRQETARRIIPIVHAHAMAVWGSAIVVRGWRMFAMGSFTEKSWQRASSLFDAWFAFGFVPRHPEIDFPETQTFPTSSLARHWAGTHLGVSDDDRAFVAAASHSPWSLMEVRDIEPGRSIDLRDLLGGRRMTVFDPELSLSVLPEQILVTGVMTVDGLSTLFCPAPFAMPGEWRDEARQIREADEGGGWVLPEDADSYSFEVFTAYRQACEDEDNQGDNEDAPLRQCQHRPSEYSPTLLRWQITQDVPQTIDALRPIVMYAGCREIDLELGPDGEARAEGYWCRASPDFDDDWHTLGFLHVDEGRLSAEVPTAGLADELQELIAQLLPDARLIGRRGSGFVAPVMKAE